jgi:hypothetical protein
MKRSRQMIVGMAIATFLLVPLRSAKAQFTNPYTWRTWNNPISSSADTAIMNRAFQRMVGIKNSGSSPSVRQATAPKSVPLSASTFKPVVNQIMPQRLAADANLNRKDQQEVAALYSQLLTSYTDLLKENGEQRLQNNIAGAMMYLVLTSHYVLSNGDEFSEAQQEEILQNLNAALAEDTSFLSLSAKAKQELYEILVISANLPLVLYTEGQDSGDSNFIKQAQELAKETVEKLF